MHAYRPGNGLSCLARVRALPRRTFGPSGAIFSPRLYPPPAHMPRGPRPLAGVSHMGRDGFSRDAANCNYTAPAGPPNGTPTRTK